MAEIRTKESLRFIKTKSFVKGVSHRIQTETQKMKKRLSDVTDPSYKSESEYAGNKMEDISRRTKRKIVSKTTEEIQKGYARSRRLIREAKKQIDSRNIPSQAKKGIKAGKKTVRSAEKTAKAAKKTAEKTAKASKRAAEAAKKAAQATAKAAKAIAQLVVKVVKAIAAGVKALAAAIASGGWVAVLIIVIICVIALVIAALFGWLIPQDNDASLYSSVLELKMDYFQKIEDIKSSAEYEEVRFDGSVPDYKGCVSLFAVKENLDPEDPKDLMDLDERAKERLRSVFWDITTITYDISIEKQTRIIELQESDGTIHPQAEVVDITILTIITEVVNREEYVERYRLTNQQKELLNELLSPEFDEMWQGIIG